MNFKEIKSVNALTKDQQKKIKGGYYPTKEEYCRNPNDPKWDVYGDNLYNCYFT